MDLNKPLIDELRREEQIEFRMKNIFNKIRSMIVKLEEIVVELREEEDGEIRNLEKHIENILKELSDIAEKRLDELTPMFKELKKISKQDAMKIGHVQNIFLKVYKNLNFLDKEIDYIVNQPVNPAKLKDIQKTIQQILGEFDTVMAETKSVESDVKKL